MGSVNKVLLLGHLGKDIEIRSTSGGTSVGTFSMATTETWRDRSDQKQEKTEWHRVVLWGDQADKLQPYLTKGKQVFVEGSLQTRQWEKDGQKHYTTEIKAHRITLLGSAGGSDERPKREEASSGSPDQVTDVDIPF